GPGAVFYPVDHARALSAAAEHLAARDTRLAGVIRRAGPCELRPDRRYLRNLISAIANQQLSGKAAATIFGRFLALYPARRFPNPQQIIDTPDETLRGTGFSRPKVAYIKDLCARVADGRLRLDRMSRLSDDEVTAALTAVHGLGVWSAQMFMMFSLVRLDVLPVGDLGIRKGFQKVYGRPKEPSAARMQAIARSNGWAPYCSVASWYLWRSLDAS
ncbi:MAG: DNA-3-methyladenine glycosylase 2 family protein, partial [Thermoflexales bacterium]